jgi:hypothetical protein
MKQWISQPEHLATPSPIWSNDRFQRMAWQRVQTRCVHHHHHLYTSVVCCPLSQVTVSTVGLIPEIRRFVPTTRAQLAVSLHATTDEVSVVVHVQVAITGEVEYLSIHSFACLLACWAGTGPDTTSVINL